MNVQEMVYAFEQKLENIEDKNFGIQRITSDISYYLNEGQRRIVEYYYAIYEQSEKARRILSPIVINADLTRSAVSSTQTGHHPNGEYWKLPTGMLYTLKEECTLNININGKVTSTIADYQRVYTRPITLDTYNRHISNPFKQPYEGCVWRIDIGNNVVNESLHELITITGVQIYQYHIAYLITPTQISLEDNTSSNLLPLVHQDIIDEAVKIALETSIVNNNLNKTK
jgi:hypothetical protein